MTTLSGVNLTASGSGQMLFPAATSYTAETPARRSMQRVPAARLICRTSRPSLARANGIYSYYSAIEAQAGGEVDLAGAFSVNTGGGRNVVTLDELAVC